MIVAAALPLVVEHGAAVTTARIARAAGIGEATVFRVFADKDELLDACVAEALSPDHAVREIASIPLEQPLAARLARAAEALEADVARIGALLGALRASGHGGRGGRRGEPGPGSGPAPDREASMAAVRQALAELFAPERDRLRVPPEQAAAVFLGLLFTRLRPEGPTGLDTAGLVDVFLHGVAGAGA
ncbi:TetR/AcrR family transcriptional regulator [Streptomyces capparidis]